MNKILSMTAYGKDSRYFVGAKRQVELSKKYYPDFKVRIYTDDIKQFYSIENEVDLIEIKDDSGVFWRFHPLFESNDNIVLVRDSDGRITAREALAVNEWLESPYSFHTWKDHEAHYEFPIIACAFGFKGKFNLEIFNAMKTLQQERFFYLNDQYFLRDFIYPIVKNDSLIHDFNQEGWFKDTKAKLINKYDFCGNGYNQFDMPLYAETIASMAEFDIKKLSEKNRFNEGVMSSE